MPAEATTATTQNIDESMKSWPIFDTGASHMLLPHTELTADQTRRAKRTHVKLAAGFARAAYVDETLYCARVSRWLLSVGQLNAVLGMVIVWDADGPKCVVPFPDGSTCCVLRPTVHHNLPLCPPPAARAVREAFLSAVKGKPWSRSQWEKCLGMKLVPTEGLTKATINLCVSGPTSDKELKKNLNVRTSPPTGPKTHNTKVTQDPAANNTKTKNQKRCERRSRARDRKTAMASTLPEEDNAPKPEEPTIALLTAPFDEKLKDKDCAKNFLEEEGFADFVLDGVAGGFRPLSEQEVEALRQHVAAGHPTKDHNCMPCVLADGPVRAHRKVETKDTQVLHVDLAGPLPEAYDGARYLVVGALRLAGRPVILTCKSAKTKSALEITEKVKEMAIELNAFQKGLPPVSEET
jgi:hypothetical protein